MAAPAFGLVFVSVWQTSKISQIAEKDTTTAIPLSSSFLPLVDEYV